MDVNIYLSFDGRCAEAFDFYARVLGGTIEAKHTWGETPMPPTCRAEEHGKIMHAQLRVGDRIIMGADAPAAWRTKPEGFSVSVNLDGRRRGAADLRRAGRGRHGEDALRADVLGQGLRHAGRPLRNPLDGQRQRSA